MYDLAKTTLSQCNTVIAWILFSFLTYLSYLAISILQINDITVIDGQFLLQLIPRLRSLFFHFLHDHIGVLHDFSSCNFYRVARHYIQG